jgi:hypothetical protein
MKTLAACAISASMLFLLSSCSTAPLSFLDGNPLTTVDPELYPVRIISIDGDFSAQNPRPVSPGPRWIVVTAAPLPGSRRAEEKSFMFKVEPCVRYHLAARRKSTLMAEWDLVVNAKESVAGCNADEELKKNAITGGKN